MAGNLSKVAEWFASLVIFTGERNVDIRDLSGIPELVEPQDCPLLSPNPTGFCSAVEFVRLTMRPRKHQLTYTLSYILYYAPVTDGVSLFDAYEGLADAWSDTITVILDNETPSGAYDIRPAGVPQFGPVSDPSGALFHGCRFDLRVTEFN
jgi:hypothetical protein